MKKFTLFAAIQLLFFQINLFALEKLCLKELEFRPIDFSSLQLRSIPKPKPKPKPKPQPLTSDFIFYKNLSVMRKVLSIDPILHANQSLKFIKEYVSNKRFCAFHAENIKKLDENPNEITPFEFPHLAVQCILEKLDPDTREKIDFEQFKATNLTFFMARWDAIAHKFFPNFKIPTKEEHLDASKKILNFTEARLSYIFGPKNYERLPMLDLDFKCDYIDFIKPADLKNLGPIVKGQDKRRRHFFSIAMVPM